MEFPPVDHQRHARARTRRQNHVRTGAHRAVEGVEARRRRDRVDRAAEQVERLGDVAEARVGGGDARVRGDQRHQHGAAVGGCGGEKFQCARPGRQVEDRDHHLSSGAPAGQEAQIGGLDVIVGNTVTVEVHQHVVHGVHLIRHAAEGVHREYQDLPVGRIVEGLHADRPQPGREGTTGAAQPPGIEIGRARYRGRAVTDVDRPPLPGLQQLRADQRAGARHQVVRDAERDAVVALGGTEQHPPLHLPEGTRITDRPDRHREVHGHRAARVAADRDRARGECRRVRRTGPLHHRERKARRGIAPVLDHDGRLATEVARELCDTETQARCAVLGVRDHRRLGRTDRLHQPVAQATRRVPGDLGGIRGVDHRVSHVGRTPAGVRLDDERGAARHVRCGHRSSRLEEPLVAGADRGREDAHSRR